MKRLTGLFLCSVIGQAVAAPSEIMGPRDLYYKLYRESREVELDLQAQKQKKIEQQKNSIDYHHKIQRIGPDPKPEEDITMETPPNPNPLHAPYKEIDKKKDVNNNLIPPEDPASDPNANAISTPPEKPADNPDRTPNIPSIPLNAPDNNSINTQNPLIKTDEQSHYLEDKAQPLKESEERPPADPGQLKDPDINPLKDPVE